jgi:hypothetical protein
VSIGTVVGFAGSPGSSQTATPTATLPTITTAGKAYTVVGTNLGPTTTVTTPPSGWALEAGPVDNASNNMRVWLYSKDVTAADSGGTFSMTLSGASRWCVVGAVLPSGSGIDVIAQWTDNTDDTTIDIPAITPTAADTYRLVLLYDRSVSGALTVAPPATGGWTELADVCSTNGSGARFGGWAGGVQLTGQNGVAQATAQATYSTSARNAGWQLTIAPAVATTTVSTTRSTTWNTGATATTSRATTWTTRATTATTRASSWTALATVSTSRATTWATNTTAATSRATTWATAATAATTRSTTWTARASVTTSRTTTWNVTSSITTVSTSRTTTWAALASTSTSKSTTWAARATIQRQTGTTWSVLTQTAAAAVATWDTLAPVTAAVTTSWDARQAVALGQATAWATLEQLLVEVATSWQVRSLAARDITVHAGPVLTRTTAGPSWAATVRAGPVLARTTPGPTIA